MIEETNQETESRPRLQSLAPGLKSRTPEDSFFYSRVVKNLRIALPAAALVIITLLVYKLSARDETQLEVTQPQKPVGQIQMSGAKYEGVDAENRPYTITASNVVRKSEEEGIVDLEMPQADMTMADGSWISASADFGRYFQTENRLTLSGIVKLFHDSGYEMQTAALDVDIKGGNAAGDADVTGQGPAGKLSAAGVKIENMGEKIIFTGPAKMTIRDHASLQKGKG